MYLGIILPLVHRNIQIVVASWSTHILVLFLWTPADNHGPWTCLHWISQELIFVLIATTQQEIVSAMKPFSLWALLQL